MFKFPVRLKREQHSRYHSGTPSFRFFRSAFIRLNQVVPEHKTGYGTNEMILLEPGGNRVWFASQEDTEAVA